MLKNWFLVKFDAIPRFSLHGTAKHERQKRPSVSHATSPRGSLCGAFDGTIGSSGASDVASALAFVEGGCRPGKLEGSFCCGGSFEMEKMDDMILGKKTSCVSQCCFGGETQGYQGSVPCLWRNLQFDLRTTLTETDPEMLVIFLLKTFVRQHVRWVLPGKLTNIPWKSMVGRCISYWNTLL